MDEASFLKKVDEAFLEIEDRIDDLSDDIDIDSSGGLLTFTFEDGSNVILSRQLSTQELWVAAKAGGFHLRFEDDTWVCGATGENLSALLNRIFFQHGATGPFS